MSVTEALLLAIALCVDSLVVSAATAFSHHIKWGRGLLLALVFAICQCVFPLLGAIVGDVAQTFIAAVDHWVAFALLAAVGGKMIFDALHQKAEADVIEGRNVSVSTMLTLGVATSIDAFAVGISLGLQHSIHTVLWVVATIAGVTFAFSVLGVWLGKCRVPLPQRTAGIIAGVVLILLGFKILAEHLL